MSTHKNIHEAILAVMAEVSNVEKDGHISRGGNYKFASEVAFINALRPHMLAHQITMHPISVEDIRVETYETSNGSTMNNRVARFGYKFTHAPTETAITVQVLGEGSDIGDKASNKAMTAAFKYALRQSFVMATGDDPDKSPSVDQQRRPAKSQERNWKEDALAKVIETVADVEDNTSAVGFLNQSGLAMSASIGAIGLFASTYQSGRDQDMNTKEALEYAKQNWQTTANGGN